jgi:hypothetical protein
VNRYFLPALAGLLTLVGCSHKPSSDEVQQAQQERILQEGTSAVGMPAIHNFRERRLLKDIYELRDQEGLTTYTYLFAEQTGKLVFLGESVGYGIPCSTQFTSPQKVQWVGLGTANANRFVLPQADPNGLFSPSSAEGTWVLLKDPHGSEVRPVYIEPRVVVSPFRLTGEAVSQ